MMARTVLALSRSCAQTCLKLSRIFNPIALHYHKWQEEKALDSPRPQWHSRRVLVCASLAYMQTRDYSISAFANGRLAVRLQQQGATQPKANLNEAPE